MEVHLICTYDTCHHNDSKSVYFSALKMEAAGYFRNVGTKHDTTMCKKQEGHRLCNAIRDLTKYPPVLTFTYV
jgi:hypothetical protein